MIRMINKDYTEISIFYDSGEDKWIASTKMTWSFPHQSGEFEEYINGEGKTPIDALKNLSGKLRD